MELRVKPEVDFLPLPRIEAVADALLRRLEEHLSEPVAPPVKVEYLVEGVLEYTLKEEVLADSSVLAYVDPNERVICTNQARLDYFKHTGYEFTWAHESGHVELGHFVEVGDQLPLELQGEPKKLIHRENVSESDKYYRHEFQANKFASNLVMPRWLLYPEAEKLNLRTWSSVYRLAGQFCVTPTIMVRRLEELGLIYVEGKTLYGNRQDAAGQLPLL